MAGVSYFPCRPIKTINTDGIIYQAPYAMPPLLADAAYVAYAPQIYYSTDVNVALESIGNPPATPRTSARTYVQTTANGVPYVRFNQGITHEYVGTVDVPQSSTDFTVAMIVRGLGHEGGMTRIYNPGASSTASWFMLVSSGGQFVCQIYTTNGNYSRNFTPPASSWYSVVMKVTGGRFYIFLNNTLTHDVSIGTATVYSNQACISPFHYVTSARRYGSGDMFLAGYWNRALTASEITEIHGYKPAD